MTIIAALAAILCYPIVGESLALATVVGAVFGFIAAWAGEVLSRLIQIRGNTHIDPPALAIFVMTTVPFIITRAELSPVRWFGRRPAEPPDLT